MFEREIAVNRLMCGYFEQAVADLRDAEWNLKPAAGGHAPLWIAGHLALVADQGCQLLGLPAAVPPEWNAAFGIGSPDDVSQPERFPRASVVQAFQENYQRLRTAVAQADTAALNRPHGIGLFADAPIQTCGDAAALILTAHLGFHLGQLSTWRRQHGRAKMF